MPIFPYKHSERLPQISAADMSEEDPKFIFQSAYKEGIDYILESDEEEENGKAVNSKVPIGHVRLISSSDNEKTPLVLTEGKRERFYSDPPVPAHRIVGYAIGGLPRTALMYVTHVYFTAYLLQMARVTAINAALILLVARCFNALSDPVVGYFVSHSPDTRFGKFAPWMMAATPFVCVCYTFLWWVPPWESQIALVFYYMFIYWLFGLSATCYGVPFVSCIMAMSNSQSQRDAIISARMTCEVAGSITGLAVHAVWLAVGASQRWAPQRAHMGSALTMVTLFFICSLVAICSVDERYSLQHNKGATRSFFKPYIQILKFRPYTIFAGCILCTYIGYSVVLGIYTLYFQYVFLAPRIFPLCAVILFSCAAFSVPVWNKFMKRFGKKTILSISTGAMIVVFWCHLFLDYSTVAVIIVVMIAGCLVGCAQLAPASMIPDIIAAYAMDNGHGKEPMFYSITVFLDTFGNAVCSAMTTFALSLAGYDGAVPPAEQPHAVETTLRVIVGGFPVVTFLIALILLWEYPITEAYRLEISDRIKQSMSSVMRVAKKSVSMSVDEKGNITDYGSGKM